MSGGAWEYVAGYMPSSSDASGFTSDELITYSKYLDLYPNNSTMISYNNRILGDATGEMGPFYHYEDNEGVNRYYNNWYKESPGFVEHTYPWFVRGGIYSHGFLTGQFNFDGGTGGIYSHVASRIVLIPSKI